MPKVKHYCVGLLIRHCIGCRDCRWDENAQDYQCIQECKIIPSVKTIPDWCPLPDAPEKKD